MDIKEARRMAEARQRSDRFEEARKNIMEAAATVDAGLRMEMVRNATYDLVAVMDAEATPSLTADIPGHQFMRAQDGGPICRACNKTEPEHPPFVQATPSEEK